MNKPLALFNQETGEVYPLPSHWMIRWNDERISDEAARIRVNAKGKGFDESNIGIWEENEKHELATLNHPEFGEMQTLNGKRKFTKLFQTSRCEFSRDSFYRIWHTVERSIEQDTGVIVNRNTQDRIEPITKMSEWIKLSASSKTLTYEFVKEATDKQYIGVWVLKPNVYWIINPQYAWNGSMIPIAIHNLFQLGKDSASAENKTGIKATPTLTKLEMEGGVTS